ncbi:MAG TPA: acyl-CoA dehydrogenase [Jatrophihabitans sp.]|nr:acyl-CoA dehydrogenase [Jatrophihabitans sp.]
MPIAVSAEARALSEALQTWARRTAPVGLARSMEREPDSWQRAWGELCDIGVLGLAAPASVDGSGGTIADLAVALEECAAALVPGPLLSTVLAGVLLGEHGAAKALATGERSAGIVLDATEVRVSRDGTLHGVARLALGATSDGLLLLSTSDGDWCLVDATSANIKVLDLDAADFSRPICDVRLDGVRGEPLPELTTARVRDLAATLAVAEASGVAAWCLRTATEYAKVREQFGKPIGSFQAVKHLCAEMLCRAEVAAAVAWDAAVSADDAAQHALAAAVAAATALDAAIENAKDCIQVLGGIGYTWEHDAHLYLRRALALRQWLGDTDVWRLRVLKLTAAGTRRALNIDLGADDQRPAVRRRAEEIAAAPAEQQRRLLADCGYLVPHWPRPYGLDAGPQLQLLIDDELARAGVRRPDLIIAGWALPTILKYGTQDQIERFLGPSLRGELVWCQLFSEPGAGSDLAGLRTAAVRAEGGWRLSGQKVWTSLADRADWGICLARTNPDVPKHKGITYFLVDMRSPGVDVRPLREITGEALFNEVFLDDVFVPDEHVVGEVDGGWALARTTLSHERVAMGGGSSIGDALERLVAQCAERGLLDDPLIASRLGRLVSAGLAGSLLDLRTALRQLGGQADEAGASVRKLVGVRHRQDVAETALDLLGPDGLVAGEHLHAFLNTRCLTIAGGTTQVLLNVAAERILGLPRG